MLSGGHRILFSRLYCDDSICRGFKLCHRIGSRILRSSAGDSVKAVLDIRNVLTKTSVRPFKGIVKDEKTLSCQANGGFNAG